MSGVLQEARGLSHHRFIGKWSHFFLDLLNLVSFSFCYDNIKFSLD